MLLTKKLLMIIFSTAFLLGIQACESQDGEGFFEEAGENVDEGVENTEEALENAGDEIDEEI